MSKKPNKYWNKITISVEALKYGRPSDFQNGSPGAYNVARKQGFLKEVCSHMTIKTYWTTESLKQEALKYESRTSFKKNCEGGYQTAYERGILDEVCSHMEYLLIYWSDDLIKKEALLHENRTDFRIKSPGAYNAARRKDILDQVCSHMIPIRTYWTDEMLAAEALKYNTRADFQHKSVSAYILSLNRKIIDNVCGHMKKSTGSSGPEREVFEFVKEYFPEAIKNTKKVIPPLEIDVYLPSINLAIEYCGLYWHSERTKKNNYHADKMKKCEELGIRLITIFEDEWEERPNQIKGYLKSAIGKNEIKLFARKLDIKEVDKKVAKVFLDTYHIQGSVRFEIALGLYSRDELVALISGGPHHRQGHSDTFVLNRLVFKSNVSVAGGSSKLLKHLLAYVKSKGFKKLLSWSDNRFSEGRVYEKMGFTLENELGPDYSYVDNGRNRVSKQSCQKKNLLKKGATGTMENTEKELAATLGLVRIWDCGKKAWSMDL